MDDKEAIPQQTPEQKKELREIATRCDHVSDRLAGHGIVFGVNLMAPWSTASVSVVH